MRNGGNVLQSRLVKRQQLGNLRQLTDRRPLVDFASNDYLGLARCPELASRVAQEWSRVPGPFNGLGSTGSRLLTGNCAYVEMTEEKIAHFHGYRAGVLFNCGYMANLGLLTSLGQSNALFLYDSAIHASMHDGIRLSRATAYPFRHQNVDHLEARLRNIRTRDICYICIESIYSTSGAKAPIRDICQLANHYGARVIVDEAHATGIYGAEGRGVVAEQDVTKSIFAQVVTFGKALGVHGAIVLGSQFLKEHLINFARSFIYSTALPFHAIAAIRCSYELFPKREQQRQHLQRLSHLFQKGTHIQSIPVPGAEAAKRFSHHLAAKGFDVRALTSPTVRQGHEVLRICLHSTNSEQEVWGLIQTLQDYQHG